MKFFFITLLVFSAPTLTFAKIQTYSANFSYFSKKYLSESYYKSFGEYYDGFSVRSSYKINVSVQFEIEIDDQENILKIVNINSVIEYQKPVLKNNEDYFENFGIRNLTGYSNADFQRFDDKNLIIQILDKKLLITFPERGYFKNEFSNLVIDTQLLSGLFRKNVMNFCKDILNLRKPSLSLDLNSNSVIRTQ